MKYVLNPASGLTIKSMQCALVYQLSVPKNEQLVCYGNYVNSQINYKNKYNHGPFELGDIDPTLNYNTRLENQGIFLNYWPGSDNLNYISQAKYNTRYVEKECFSNTRFKVWNNDAIKIWCKLVITFKPINSDKEIVAILTYPTKIEQSNLYKTESDGPTYTFKNLKRHRNRYFDWDCLCWYESNNEEDYHLMYGTDCIKYHPISKIDPSPFGEDLISNTKEVIEIENINFTQNTTIYAWKKIIVKNNVTMNDGIELKFIAGESIDLGNNFEAKPGFNAIISKMPFCNTQNIEPVSQSEISSFCQSNKYKELIILQSNKREIEDSLITNKFPYKSTLVFKLSPNPTTSNFNVALFNNNEQDYSIALMDVTGKVLFNNKYNGKQTSQHIETNGLAAGIYFVRITCGNTQKTEKLIIQSNY